MADSFTHLHVHTEYSMLDGAARIGEVVAAAARDGQPALGITDHGNMYGILDFYKECRAQGIKPILGSELYMAHESRHERPSRRGRMDDGGGDAEGGAEALLPPHRAGGDERGLPEPHQAEQRGVPLGYYYKPRADFDLLAEHSEGLIVTSGCLGGHVLQALMRDDIEGRAQGGAGGCRTSSGATRSSSRCRTTASRSSAAPTRCSSSWPSTCRRRCSPPTTATTSTRATRSRTTRCSACRPGRR